MDEDEFDAEFDPVESVAVRNFEVIEDREVFSRTSEALIFRYCSISGALSDGSIVDATFLSTTLRDIDLYWGLFNSCLFVDCEFRNCIFRGTSFGSCRFLECKFIDCQFVKDNLDGDCHFEGSTWHESEQSGCAGLPSLVPLTRKERRRRRPKA